MSPRSFELVIFDCDGVLVDSERITNRVFAQMLNELGLPVTVEDMFEQFVGHSMQHCLGLITDMLGQAPPKSFVEAYKVRTRAALEVELAAVAGIEEVLDEIRLPYCVASSGDHEKMRTILGITGLWPRFDGKLFSVTEVSRGKPFPDVFLLAAERLGVDPSACAVVEDTPVGVAAGVAAGMTVFGYSALTPARRLLQAGAHMTFDRMQELPALLGGGA
ncbi:MAG TPA: HAD family phosphatase [Candidatus Acidoferrum sp.]|nr:HAD family phosphatase [Candidatus Acidoferrum sp.]